VALLVAAAAAYVVAFLLLYPAMASGAAALGALPVGLAGWMFGLRGGVAAGLLCAVLNTLLLNLNGEPGWDAVLNAGGGVGTVVIVVIGAAIGRMADLARKVERQAGELERQATRDPLTDLSNRDLFLRRLEQALSGEDRESVALLFLDLDDFKAVNDSLGHTAGDLLLVAVAQRIQGSVQASDTVCRMGGDEFAVLLKGIPGTEEALRVARRVSSRLEEPFGVEGHKVRVTVSVGVALGSVLPENPGVLLRNADLAMYRAKHAGKARCEAFAGE
jgi:diguanylate cyclase (GGDEF)-like protein